jgi:osmotically-inducible protein OsmY
MPRSSRDRISVDLCGLRLALYARARERGLSPSDLVRRALTEALHGEAALTSTRPGAKTASDQAMVRLSLRMSRADAEAMRAAAKRAGLSRGAYVAGLVAGIPVLLEGSVPREYLAALTLSSAEMATLGRDLQHLSSLLRQGSTRAAQEYRERLDAVAGDVRQHLTLAAAALAAMQPRRNCGA